MIDSALVFRKRTMSSVTKKQRERERERERERKREKEKKKDSSSKALWCKFLLGVLIITKA